MFDYPLFSIMHFCYEKNVQFPDRSPFCIIEEIRKIFLRRNLSLMPENVLFLLKNCKNRQTLGSAPKPLYLWRMGASPPDPPHQSSYIVNSSLCICLQSTDSFEINQKIYFLVIIAGVHQASFRPRKNYAAFLMPQITEIITILGFNFFVLLPPPTHFPMAPPLASASTSLFDIPRYAICQIGTTETSRFLSFRFDFLNLFSIFENCLPDLAHWCSDFILVETKIMNMRTCFFETITYCIA